jgi:glucosamine-6-phosphate deaminase
MDVRIFPNVHAVDDFAAREIAALIEARAVGGKLCVLGLAAGVTPIAVYRVLIDLYRHGLSFANVATFNLDEYYPISPSSPRSCCRFIRENFLDHVDLDPANVHELDGSIPVQHVAEHCARYEQAIVAAGGIDLQLLGIGRNGHIGFNEPGSPRSSRTRLVTLDAVTRRDAQGSFGQDEVPQHAITMGIDSILSARQILLLAAGRHKAAIVGRAVEAAVTGEVPASFLQEHANASVYLDPAAAERLSRFSQRE